MQDLIAFTEARLDEEEEAAQDTARGNPGPWSLDHAWIRDATGETVVMDEYRWGGSAFTHIARYDPARVLREVAAKRARLDAYIAANAAVQRHGDLYMTGVAHGLAVAVKGDAASWDNHPDYKQAWAP